MREFYQITLAEYAAGDIEYKPKVTRDLGGRRHYWCPVCNQIVGGFMAGEEWFRDCPNGHRLDWREIREQAAAR